MTDTRLPERWLNDWRFLDLTDGAYRLYMTALMATVANRTEGYIDDRKLGRLPSVDPACAVELEKAGLWKRSGDQWFIVDAPATQTSNAELEAAEIGRQHAREKKARQRARQREESQMSPGTSPGTSQARPGQDRPGQANDVGGSKFVQLDVKDDPDDWPTPREPGSGIPSQAAAVEAAPGFAAFGRRREDYS